MNPAPSTLPATAPAGLTCGIDWARDDHAVAVVDAAQLSRLVDEDRKLLVVGVGRRVVPLACRW